VGALSHVRVLDLSRVLAGPWATQILGDLGAEVIKIERPGTGDDTRGWGPPYLKDAAGNPTRESAYFQSCNRNKKSVTIDMARPEGQKLVRALAVKSDIVFENFKVGGLAAYGLDYQSLKQVNPAIIYCSITGFGQTGPYSERAGYDFLIQAMGGIMSVTGEPDGKPGGGPVKIGVALADIMAGMYATVAVLAGLAHRERSGEGQYIDLSLLDVQVGVLANQALNYLVTGKTPRRMGNAHPNLMPYDVFATRDGHMVLAIGNDAQFARFCEVAGCPQVAVDARYATNSARVTNRATLMEIVGSAIRSNTTAWWIQKLEQVAVPCGPINSIDQVFADPQVRARGMQLGMQHGTGVEVPLVASPLRLSETPPEYVSAPPLLGQHTEEVLLGVAGVSASELAKLRAAGVV
jgi:crotonobetainyl-CoA:carnitine CoA-transferase CaiB-like acyl-CoA transferase